MSYIKTEHKVNVRYKKVQEVLYLRVLRAIYCCTVSYLQWYTIYIDTLKKKVEVINPYDCCVAKKIIEGKNTP